MTMQVKFPIDATPTNWQVGTADSATGTPTLVNVISVSGPVDDVYTLQWLLTWDNFGSVSPPVTLQKWFFVATTVGQSTSEAHVSKIVPFNLINFMPSFTTFSINNSTLYKTSTGGEFPIYFLEFQSSDIPNTLLWGAVPVVGGGVYMQSNESPPAYVSILEPDGEGDILVTYTNNKSDPNNPAVAINCTRLSQSPSSPIPNPIMWVQNRQQNQQVSQIYTKIRDFGIFAWVGTTSTQPSPTDTDFQFSWPGQIAIP
jgi:hypothetical protein